MSRFHINTDNSDRGALIRIIRVCEGELEASRLRRRIMLVSLGVNVVLIGFIIRGMLP